GADWRPGVELGGVGGRHTDTAMATVLPAAHGLRRAAIGWITLVRAVHLMRQGRPRSQRAAPPGVLQVEAAIMEVARVVDVCRVVVERGTWWPRRREDEVGFLEQHRPPAHRRRQLRATRRDEEVELDLTILIGVQMLLRQVDEDLFPHAADAIVD